MALNTTDTAVATATATATTTNNFDNYNNNDNKNISNFHVGFARGFYKKRACCLSRIA